MINRLEHLKLDLIWWDGEKGYVCRLSMITRFIIWELEQKGKWVHFFGFNRKLREA